MKQSYHILIDDREKKPLLFPDHLVMLDDTKLATARILQSVRLLTSRAHLETADYQLDGADPSNSAIVERKGSVRELANNLLTFNGRRRFMDELERLHTWRRRILLLEGTPHSLSDPLYAGATDSLIRLLRQHSVELYLLPASSPAQKLAAGTLVSRLLINETLL